MQAQKAGSGIRVALNFAVIGDGNLTAAQIAEALQGQANALTAKTPVNKPVKGKKAKAKDEDDESDSDSESDANGDEDDSVSDADDGEDSEESESEEEDSDDEADSDGEDSDDGEAEEDSEDALEGRSQKDCIGLLKKLAEATSKKKAMAVMKKATGKDSIYDVKDKKKYGVLVKALKAAIKEAA